MTDATPLDDAHAAMLAASGADAARLRFYERLADAELYLLLKDEPDGQDVTPETVDLSGNTFVLAFDREERLSGFAGRVSPYAALSGRAICRMLAPEGLGLALNLDVAPSSFLMPPEAVSWLAETLDQAPGEMQEKIERFSFPKGLGESFLRGLDRKLASAAGMATCAYLAGAVYRGGSRGHVLGFVDALPGAEPALAQAVSEALVFSGLEDAVLDVGFFRAGETATKHLARYGLRFDLPQPQERRARQPEAPGMDPEKPPILR